MSVNSMALEDVYQLINSLHAQVTGNAALTATDVSSFISVATSTLQAGTDTVYNQLMQTIGRTIFAVRPYNQRFSGLKADEARWGGIIRKISYGDDDIAAESFQHPVDGQSVDQYVQKKGQILEMRYYGSDIYQDGYTVYRDQLINAFAGPEQLGSFIAGKVTHMSNKWNQYEESLARSALLNFIAGKLSMNNGVVHLLTEYNTLTGGSLTITDLYSPAVQRPFWQWVRARINTLSRRMENRSGAFQVAITGKNINRHSPIKNQKIYMLADYLDIIDTMVNTNTYHDEPLKYADVQGVDFWQSFNTPANINIKPAIINAAGVVSAASAAVVETDILGVIFDEDAVAYNVKDKEIANTPYNARGRYYNTWLSANTQYMNDFTEKGIVLVLD